MSENTIDSLRYIKGYSGLGEQTLDVVLFALPNNLTVSTVNDNKPLFSIPWGNFSDGEVGVVFKTGLSSFAASALRATPLGSVLHAADPTHDGVWITFWDEEVQRSQVVFFATRSERQANQLLQKIYFYRDQYFLSVGKRSGPTVRKPS